jgi:hypothetical protein
MTWVKIDDSFFRHPKVRAAGRDARDLQLAALQYCNENLTDGFVPEYEIMRLAMEAFVDIPAVPAAVESLLNKRQFNHAMWQRVEGGFHVHDFHDYQPTASEVRKEREDNARRQKDFRDRQRGASKDEEKTPSGSRNSERNSVTNAEKEPFFDQCNVLLTDPPVSRIPSPDSRIPREDARADFSQNELVSARASPALQRPPEFLHPAILLYQQGFEQVKNRSPSRSASAETAAAALYEQHGAETYCRGLTGFFTCLEGADDYPRQKGFDLALFVRQFDTWEAGNLGENGPPERPAPRKSPGKLSAADQTRRYTEQITALRGH